MKHCSLTDDNGRAFLLYMKIQHLEFKNSKVLS